MFDRESGERITEIEDDALDYPSGIGGVGDRIFVSQGAFRGSAYEEGSVVEINRSTRTVETRTPTSAKNPQFLSVINFEEKTWLAVVNSGEFDVTESGAFVKTAGSLELWDIAVDPVARESFELPLVEDRRIGSPAEAHQV